MQYTVELYFDNETENKLFELAKKIAAEKISTRFLEWKTRPHLTLACFNDSKTIFVSPVMNSRMYQFQRELQEALNCFDTKGWEWYCPDRWVPHIH